MVCIGVICLAVAAAINDNVRSSYDRVCCGMWLGSGVVAFVLAGFLS